MGRVAGDSSTDKLAQILSRGTLILSTDPAYPPQSYLVKGAKRLLHTKCLANQMTANQMAGYDADTGKLVAKRLGVEACFVTPTWSEIISGHWNDRWDISYGSGAINSDRANRLYFTQPYYAAPQLFFVALKSKYKKPQRLEQQGRRRLRRLRARAVPEADVEDPRRQGRLHGEERQDLDLRC